MLFSVEEDAGDVITGYLVPDTFAGLATLTLSVDGQEIITLQTNELRSSLVDARRHATGLCGFKIDTNILPNLRHVENLEIYAKDPGILIYRRPSSQFIAKRIVRIETHLLPLLGLDRAFGNSFQYFYSNADRYGRETVDQLFHLKNTQSFYMSGRILVRSYEHLLDENTNIVVVLRKPQFELAERILLLRHAASMNEDILNVRDNFLFQAALEFSQGLNLTNTRALSKSFKRISSAVASTFSNPLTRALAAQFADEPLYDGSVATALSTLASCTVVGLRSDFDSFVEDLCSITGCRASSIPSFPEYDRVAELGTRLVQIKAANRLLEKDIQLYSAVLNAREKANYN